MILLNFIATFVQLKEYLRFLFRNANTDKFLEFANYYLSIIYFTTKKVYLLNQGIFTNYKPQIIKT